VQRYSTENVTGCKGVVYDKGMPPRISLLNQVSGSAIPVLVATVYRSRRRRQAPRAPTSPDDVLLIERSSSRRITAFKEPAQGLFHA